MTSRSIRNALSRVQVPIHPRSKWHHSGGVTLFFLAVQALSGVLLALRYIPSVDGAHASIVRIVTEAPMGWFVRSVHIWSSHFLILSAFVHFASKYFLRSYREMNAAAWHSGILLIMILAGFAFTGQVLPWDAAGYYAARIGTGIAGKAPLIGEWLLALLGGGSGAGEDELLPRIYALHVVALPLMAFLLMSFHLLRAILDPWSIPEGMTAERTIPLYPHFAVRTAMVWIAAAGILITLGVFLPWDLGVPVDTGAPAPPGVRPPWYFLPFYQILRLLPGSIGGIGTESILFIVLFAGAGFLAVIPRIDRRMDRLTGALGIVAVLYSIVSIVASWLDLWPFI